MIWYDNTKEWNKSEVVVRSEWVSERVSQSISKIRYGTVQHQLNELISISSSWADLSWLTDWPTYLIIANHYLFVLPEWLKSTQLDSTRLDSNGLNSHSRHLETRFTDTDTDTNYYWSHLLHWCFRCDGVGVQFNSAGRVASHRIDWWVVLYGKSRHVMSRQICWKQ